MQISGKRGPDLRFDVESKPNSKIDGSRSSYLTPSQIPSRITRPTFPLVHTRIIPEAASF